MSANALSPTARVLRSSRLFAVPAPLKEAPLGAFSIIGEHHSATATKPFPLRASIVTPKSSLQKGDWGLKRALPRKLNNTSTPVIRVKAVDSWAHITEYESAADHSLALEKFQELNLPITAPVSRNTAQPMFVDNNTTSKGVFDQNVHSTDASLGAGGNDQRRWKFSGPPVASMSAGEFQEYLSREISGRETEFREFLRTKLGKLPVTTEDGQSIIKAESSKAPTSEKPTAKLRATDDAALSEFIEELRSDFTSLMKNVEEFLDLPPPHTSRLKNTSRISSEIPSGLVPNEFEQDIGPMRTHPSAGLSYLRSGTQMPNHPLLGPQQYPRPVVARVLSPASTTAYGRRVSQRVKIGVAGFVADDPATNGQNYSSSQRVTGLIQFEADNPGGTKLFVHPTRAMIDSDGSVNVEVTRASSNTLAIRNGAVFDPSTEKPAYRSLAGSQPRSMLPERTLAGFQQGGGRAGQNNRAGRNGFASRNSSDFYNSLESVIDGKPAKR